MKKTLVVSALLSLLASFSIQAQTIATWTFETSVPTNSGPYDPEIGSGSATGFHAGATVYSNPVGNGSGESFSSTLWAVDDYYQFQVSTIGFNDIGVSFDQVSSSTGPGEFNFQYSTDGTSFTTFGSTYTVLANSSPNNWSSGTPITSTSYFFDLSSVTELNNQSTVYFRLTDASTTAANGGTVATTGTDRVDNFSVFVVVPEPSTIAMASIGGVALLMAFRRRE